LRKSTVRSKGKRGDRICVEQRSAKCQTTWMLSVARPVLAGLILAVASVACSELESNGTPGPSSGPAFVVASFHQHSCGQDRCVEARLQNEGDRSGAGTCRLLVTHHGPNGDESVEGPSIALPVVAPGESVARTVHWSGPVPDGYLRLLCEPGMRM